MTGPQILSPAAAATGLRRERVIAMASLLALAALAWIYLWYDARGMAAGAQGSLSGLLMTVSATKPWSLLSLALAFLMWSVMMVGMMLPSAVPAILMYGTLARKHRQRGSALPAVWVFAAGYLAVWTAFSLAAVLLEAALQAGGLLNPMLVSTSGWLTGGLLIAAGVYQWLPIKRVCLEKCRAPLQFFMMRWRPGPRGAVLMGVEHGAFCVGCCWVLMLLLFAAGVMDLMWVVVIAAFVLVEKLFPFARAIGWASGALLAAGGVAAIAS
jgi:predicted metal-binding membrane protein